jgi:GTPase-activating protein SAC7
LLTNGFLPCRAITTDCITLGSEIARALMVLNGFVREVREARSDVDGISRELHSLQSVLDLLKDDAGFFPYDLAVQTPAVLDHCSMVVDELDVCLALLNGDKLTRQEKRKHWIAHGRQDSARFRTSLEAHRSIIGLALDFVGAYVLAPQL